MDEDQMLVNAVVLIIDRKQEATAERVAAYCAEAGWFTATAEEVEPKLRALAGTGAGILFGYRTGEGAAAYRVA